MKRAASFTQLVVTQCPTGDSNFVTPRWAPPGDVARFKSDLDFLIWVFAHTGRESDGGKKKCPRCQIAAATVGRGKTGDAYFYCHSPVCAGARAPGQSAAMVSGTVFDLIALHYWNIEVVGRNFLTTFGLARQLRNSFARSRGASRFRLPNRRDWLLAQARLCGINPINARATCFWFARACPSVGQPDFPKNAAKMTDAAIRGASIDEAHREMVYLCARNFWRAGWLKRASERFTSPKRADKSRALIVRDWLDCLSPRKRSLARARAILQVFFRGAVNCADSPATLASASGVSPILFRRIWHLFGKLSVLFSDKSGRRSRFWRLALPEDIADLVRKILATIADPRAPPAWARPLFTLRDLPVQLSLSLSAD